MAAIVALLLVTLTLTQTLADLPDRSSPIFFMKEAQQFVRQNPLSVKEFFRSIPDSAKAEQAWGDAFKLDDEPDQCDSCEVFVLGLALIAKNTSWDAVRDSFVDICVEGMNSLNPNAEAQITCEAVMDGQGPHIFAVFEALNTGPLAQKPTPLSMCESMNQCFRDPPCGAGTAGKMEPEVRGKPNTWRRTMSGRRRIIEKLMGEYRPKRRSENIFRVAQIADIHVDDKYTECGDRRKTSESDVYRRQILTTKVDPRAGETTECNYLVCCREGYPGTGSAGAWGDYECSTPPSTVQLFLDEVDKMSPKPDLIIYSGDNPPHIIWEETYDRQYGCSQWVVEAMKNTFQNERVLPNLGNHEMYPANLFYMELEETVRMSHNLTDLWEDLAGFGADEISTMKKGGYYATDVNSELRVISFNTNYWYIFNWYLTLMDAEENAENEVMFTWLADELQAAKDNNQQVILIGHHPPGNLDACAYITQCVNNILVQYADIIQLYVAGHTHFDEFRLFKDAGSPKVVVNVAPAITPLGGINPSIRVYELDKETYEMVDYVQYRFDLEEAIAEGDDPEIREVYRATTEYDMEDVSPESWQDLVDRMWTDDDLFDQHYAHAYTEARERTCSEDCKISRLCHLENANYDEIQACIDENTPEEPDSSPAPSSATTISMYGGVITSALLMMRI